MPFLCLESICIEIPIRHLLVKAISCAFHSHWHLACRSCSQAPRWMMILLHWRVCLLAPKRTLRYWKLTSRSAIRRSMTSYKSECDFFLGQGTLFLATLSSLCSLWTSSLLWGTEGYQKRSFSPAFIVASQAGHAQCVVSCGVSLFIPLRSELKIRSDYRRCRQVSCCCTC